MEYLAKFDDAGRRVETVVSDIHYQGRKGREKYIEQGFVLITEDDWNYYIGNHGLGDNGTGYIRDPETGKPVSAPAYVPTKEEKATLLFRECQQDLNEIDSQIVNAIIMKDTKLEKELRQERDERIAKYQKELDDLGGEE